MLVLTRKIDQQIQIGENIRITIVRVKGQSVRIGIEAPKEVGVMRAELLTDVQVVEEEEDGETEEQPESREPVHATTRQPKSSLPLRRDPMPLASPRLTVAGFSSPLSAERPLAKMMAARR